MMEMMLMNMVTENRRLRGYVKMLRGEERSCGVGAVGCWWLMEDD